jgi:hypothetical protein
LFVLFSGDLTGIRWRVLHMFTTFAAFVSTRVTLAYSCVRLWHLCPHQQVSQIVWLLESGEFAPPTNLRKNDWVNLKIIWKEGVTNKVLSRKVLTKLITSPGAAYFSTKKNSPQEWLLPIVVLGFDISAHTKRFLRLFGCLKATMGGSGKTLDSFFFFFRRLSNAHEWYWSCFSDRDGMKF